MEINGQLLEEEKINVRSILLTAPKGFALQKFRKEYQASLGQPLPFKKFGYSSEVKFLESMRDVVDVSFNRILNDYLLVGIADRKTSHIEKLVSKQKVSKQNKIPVPTKKFVKKMVLPPRIQTTSGPILPGTTKIDIVKVIKPHASGISLHDFQSVFKRTYDKELNFRKYGFNTLRECLSGVSDIKSEIIDGIVKFYYPNGNETLLSRLRQPSPVVNKVIAKPVETKTTEDKRNSDQSWPEFVIPPPVAPEIPAKVPEPFAKVPEPFAKVPVPFAKVPEPFAKLPEPSADPVKCRFANKRSGVKISAATEKEFRQVLELNPAGIWANDFAESYEELTSKVFDLDDLAFTSFEELFHSLDNVFRCQHPKDKGDFLLFDASKNTLHNFEENFHFQTKNGAIIAQTISNMRKLLQKSPEGINLVDFTHVYNLNYSKPFILSDFGFNSIDKFLNCIAEQVPLKVTYCNGHKNVKLGLEITPTLVHTRFASWKSCLTRKIPEEIVESNFRLANQAISSSSNTGTAFPVKVSSSINPSDFWVQLADERNAEELESLMDDLDDFYTGPYGSLYVMLDKEMVCGTLCVAIWAGDGSWQRITIVEVFERDSCVRAFYVDLGSFDKVLYCNMRYLRKEFAKLPAQAIKAKMGDIKPKNGETWSMPVCMGFSKLCNDKVLMAEVIATTPESNAISLSLRDSNELGNVSLNKSLVREGLAVYCTKSRHDVSSSQSVALLEELGVSEENVAQALQTILKIQSARTIVDKDALINCMLQTVQDNLGSSSDTEALRNMLHSGLMSKTTNPCNGTSQECNNNELQYEISSLSPPSSFKSSSMSEMSSPRSLSNSVYNGLGNGHMYARGEAVNSDQSPKIATLVSENHGQECVSPSSTIFYSDSSDIFEEFSNEEDYLDELCAQYANLVPRHVQRIHLQDRFQLHLVKLDDRPYVPSADISRLMWCQDKDYLRRRLPVRETVRETTISENDYPQVFQQLRHFKVSGIEERQEYAVITLYPLDQVIEILNIFGHPSTTLREEISQEIQGFHPQDEVWKNFENIEIQYRYCGTQETTDEARFQKLCIYDLKVILEKLRGERLKLLQNFPLRSDNRLDELHDIECKMKTCEKRIVEIEYISTAFYFKTMLST